MNVKTILKTAWKKSVQFYRKRLKPKSWRRVFLKGAIGLGLAALIGIVTVLYYAFQLPDLSVLVSRRVNESTKIYDRTGSTVLYDVHGEEKRTIIPWEQIPTNIKNATLAAEDSSFYQHSGIDLRGIIRALYKDISTLSASEGGSTITQQLVKQALIGDQKTLSRKIKEALLAIQIERAYSKDYIFWMYLNQIPYGSNTYGIEAASTTYFGKSARDLTPAEAALLAGMPKAPSYYSPYGTHTTQLRARARYILDRMNMLGYLSDIEYQAAIAELPTFHQAQEQFDAPHFVSEVKKYLLKKYGTDQVENGGLKVITTIDMNLQDIASSSLVKYGEVNEKKYKASNAALVALDPRTGQILAMVGSRNYFGSSSPAGCNPGVSCKFDPQTNVAVSPRQPGSSFKPFAYATAFEKGYPDSTMLYDLPIEFNPACDSAGKQEKSQSGACYHPQNYSLTFTGPVTMRNALQRSLNVPAVETLYLAGINNTVETARGMGISTLSKDDSGLSLVLGAPSVSLLDMVSAYGVFANDGVRLPSTYIIKITGADGAVLEEYKQDEERVLPAQVARMISDVLSDNNARAPVFGATNSLYLGARPVAAKTGTTQKNRDGWLLGYTPSLAVGVWTGNNDDTSMTAAGAGVSAAGPLWNEFMLKALKNTPIEYFEKPNPIFVDKPMFNGDYRSPNGEIHSILHYVIVSDPTGQFPSNPYAEPQYKNWEAAVQAWALATGQSFFVPTPIPVPDATPGTTTVPWVTFPPPFPTPQPSF